MPWLLGVFPTTASFLVDNVTDGQGNFPMLGHSAVGKGVGQGAAVVEFAVAKQQVKSVVSEADFGLCLVGFWDAVVGKQRC